MVAEALRIVGAPDTFGRRIAEQAVDGRIGELLAAAGAVAGLVEKPRDRLLPPMLEEKLVEPSPDRCLLRIGDEHPSLKLVAEGSGAPERLPELRPDGNRGGDALSDLLALPLRHGGDHRVKEPAGRRGGVDRLLKRDKVGVVITEEVREIQEVPCVARKARELREDERLNAATPHVGHHPLGLGMLADGFSAHAFEPVDVDDSPATGLGIVPRTLLVVLGALALCLVLGRDPDPDADASVGSHALHRNTYLQVAL